jgi:hypothetical protein
VLIKEAAGPANPFATAIAIAIFAATKKALAIVPIAMSCHMKD